MLADNRGVIADILDGLAIHAEHFGVSTRRRMIAGADTLYWSMRLDATPTGSEVEELERLREFAEAVDEVLGRIKVEGLREHPAAKVSAIRAAYGAIA